MVFRDLHEPLDGISENLDKESGVMALLQWAKAEGKVQELSDALIADKPGNQSVQAYKRSVSKQTPSPRPMYLPLLSIPNPLSPIPSITPRACQASPRYCASRQSFLPSVSSRRPQSPLPSTH